MLKGFEYTTYDITDYEKSVLVPVFVDRFKGRIGKQRAVSNKKIIKALKQDGYKVGDGIRVRKIINYIRNQRLTEGCLIANSKGYFISFNPIEIREYIESLEGRETEIKKIKQSVKDYLIQAVSGKQEQIKF